MLPYLGGSITHRVTGEIGSEVSTARFDKNVQNVPKWISVFTASVAVCSIFIWLCIPSLKAFSSGSMKFNTALSILALSIAVFSLANAKQTTRTGSQRLPFGLALFAFLVGLGTLLQYLFNFNLGIDELLILDYPSQESVLHPGRMSPIAAICMVALGLSCLLVDKFKSLAISPSAVFILPPIFLATLSLVGYLNAESTLYQFGPFIRISWQSAMCCGLLSIAILLLRPASGPGQILTSHGPGGMMARRLLPIVMLAPVILGLLWLQGRRNETVSRELGVSLFVVAMIFIFVTGIAFVARRLDLLDSERKKLVIRDRTSQQALAESELQFRSMANSISQLAWMANKDGWIFWYNERWYEYTGATFADMEGWGWEKVHDPAQISRVSASWKKAIQAGEPWEDRFPLRRKDGTWRWFLTRARPMRNEAGQIVFWFGTNTDIQDQFQNERELIESRDAAERANQAKTQFLANMSHEIRTPIGAIMGFAELLKNPMNSEAERSSFTNVIERNSQNLLRLIDDILDLSKVEAGKIALEETECNLIELLSDLKSLMGLRAAEKSIQFVLRFDGLIPDRIKTDSLRLRQILTNIIGNAIKFTDVGEVECVVKYRRPDLIFTVRDTGLGVSPEGAANLFRAFNQADPSMTRRFGGTGLGLVLSKKLSQALGGDVRLVNSEVGIGSVFEVSVKAESVADPRLVGPESLVLTEHLVGAQSEQKGRLTKLRVLIVDDATDNRTLISLYLNKSGAQVSTAVDGEEAVSKALSTKPDVVLMDIQMPKMDGHTATKKLRSLGFSKPIIALTAHAMREERDRCFASGCTDYLTKPIQRDVLIATLERYISKAH